MKVYAFPLGPDGLVSGRAQDDRRFSATSRLPTG